MIMLFLSVALAACPWRGTVTQLDLYPRGAVVMTSQKKFYNYAFPDDQDTFRTALVACKGEEAGETFDTWVTQRRYQWVALAGVILIPTGIAVLPYDFGSTLALGVGTTVGGVVCNRKAVRARKDLEIDAD